MNIGEIKYYLSIFMQRLPLFLLVATLVSGAGIAVAYLLPSVYRGTAKILVESPQIPTELARSTVPENAVAQLQIIEQEMLTTNSMLALANKFGIYANRPRISQSDIVDDMKSRTRIDPLYLGTDAGALAFSVSFDAENATLSADVTNSLASTILDKDAALRTSRAADTLHFFQQEVDRLSAELKTSESQILEFKNTHIDALPDSLEFRRSQQSNLEERLLLLDREESSLKNKRSTLVQLFKNTGMVIDGGAQTPKGKLLENLNAALASQLLVFSESSPTIIALRAQIAQLSGELDASKPAATKDTEKLPPSELDVQLADIDDRLTAIASEKTSIGKSAVQTSATIEATPANETALNALERASQNIQTQYNSAVARLAEASTGEQIELRLKGQRLSLIEGALPPARPFGPKRLFIAIGSVIGGIVLGLGLVVMIEFMGRKVRRAVDIEKALGIEPLVTIPYIRAFTAPHRRRILGFLSIALLFAFMPLASSEIPGAQVVAAASHLTGVSA